jgi:hypothetical protein
VDQVLFARKRYGYEVSPGWHESFLRAADARLRTFHSDGWRA